MNNTLKLLAQKAKKRLSNAGQNIFSNETDKSFSKSLSVSNYVTIATKQDIEDDPLFDKVKKLMTKDEVFNPLAELTDYKIFNCLSQPEKEKYIIDIARRYNQIKDYFISVNALA